MKMWHGWDGTGQRNVAWVGWYWTTKIPSTGRKIPHSRGHWVIMYNVNGYSSVSIVTKLWAERPMLTSLFLFVLDSSWVRSLRGSISEGHLVLLPKVKVTRML
jgi:hypothetical protein